MKKFAKKGLSLLLAVIMLMSTLPMNAMAAMVMDPEGSERVEVPVLDKTDHVVDTMAGPISSGSERPETPTPGGDEEANEHTLGDVGVGTAADGAVFSSANLKTGDDAGGGNVVAIEPHGNGSQLVTIALVPNFRLGVDENPGTVASETIATQENLHPTGNALNTRTFYVTYGSIYPIYAARTASITFDATKNEELRLTTNGDIFYNGFRTPSNKATDRTGVYSDFTDALNTLMEKLVAGEETAYDESGKALTTKLPYKVYCYFGDNTYVTGDITFALDVPQGPGLEITITTTPVTVGKTYSGQITTAVVKNISDETVENITVTIARSKGSSVAVGSTVYPAAVDADAGASDTYAKNYGLGDSGSIDVTFSIPVSLAPGESYTVPISGNGGNLAMASALREGNHTYRLNASGTIAGTSDTTAAEHKDGNIKAGINVNVTVRLIDTAGNPITETHTVASSGGTALTKTGANVYTGAVAVGDTILVDGVDTGDVVIGDASGNFETDVTLYHLVCNVDPAMANGEPTGITKTVDSNTVTWEYFMPGMTVTASVGTSNNHPDKDNYATYTISTWTGADTIAANKRSATVEMDEDKELVAVYVDSKVKVKLTTILNNAASGTNHLGSNAETDPLTMSGTVQIRSIETRPVTVTLTSDNYLRVYGYWEVALDKDKQWEIVINGQVCYADADHTTKRGFNTADGSDAKLEETVYVGQVNKLPPASESGSGTTNSGSYLALAADEGSITDGVTHADRKNTLTEVYTLPEFSDLTVTIKTGGSDVFSKLTYPDSSTDVTPASGTTQSIQVQREASDLEATYRLPYTATVDLYADGVKAGASGSNRIRLRNGDTNAFVTGTYSSGTYTFTNLDPSVTYTVYFGTYASAPTEEGSTLATGATITFDTTTARVDTQMIAMAAFNDSTSTALATAAQRPTFTGGGTSGTQGANGNPVMVLDGATITVTVKDLSGSNLNYVNMTKVTGDADVGDGAMSDGTKMTVTYTAKAGTNGKGQTLTAHYADAITVGTVEVTINLNDKADTANAHTVVLTKSATNGTTGAITLSDSATPVSIYTNADVTATGTGEKYYIWVDGVCVDTTGFTLDVEETVKKTVDYYTVEIDGTDSSVKASSAAVTGGTANTVNSGYLSGTTGLVLEAEPATNYDKNAATWTDQVAAPGSVSGTKGTSGAKATYTLGTITKETKYKVTFDKLKSQSVITVKKNDGTLANYAGFNGSVVLSTSATDSTAGAITLIQDGTNKYQFTTAANALTVGDTYYVWATNTDNGLGVMYTGITFTASETAANNNKDVTYYKLTVKADTNGTAAGAKVGLGKDNTVAVSASSVENYYLSGSTPYIIADASAGLYDFDKWTASNVTVGTTGSYAVQQVTTTANVATATAGYTKVRFDATFTLSLDGIAPTIGASNPITGVKLVDKSGNTVSSGVTSAAGTNSIVYTASQIPSSEADYKWVVTTVSGDYEVTEVSGSANTDSTMKLYSVHVTASGTGWSGATVAANGQTTTAGTTAVGLSTSSFTLGLTAASGFTQEAGTGSWTQSTAGRGTVAPTSYTSLVTATGWPNTGVTLTPNFTYSVTLVPTRDDSATPVVAMTSGVTSVSAGSTAASENTTTHKWTVTGLEPGTTGTSYTVSVNGFASSITIDTGDAGTEVPVQMYEIKTVKDPATSNGSAYVNLGANATGTATAVYVPKGASTTTTGATQVSVAAAAGSTYRLRTVAKDGSGNTTWTNLDGAGAGSDTATTKVTFSNIADDIEVTAHYVEQFTVKLQQSNGGSSTIKGETVTTPTGSTWNPTTAAASATGTIDSGNIIKITANADTGYQLKGWKITGGDLYGSESSGTLSDQVNVSANQDATDTDLYLSTDTEVFVKVTAATTVTAVYEAGTYPVTITVKKDNAAYTGLTVELKNKKSTDTSYTGANALTDNGDGTYTVRALAGTYDIYVNGTNVGAATTDTEKDIEVKTTGGPFAEEVYYYTVDLVTSPASIPAADEVYVDHNSSVRGTSSVTSIIMLAKSGAYTTNVAATANNYGVTGATTHYRFDNWSVAPTANGGSMGSTSAAATTYQLPAEGTLKTNSNITASNHITLTATFQAQWKVTVSNADGTNGGTISQPSGTGFNVQGTWSTTNGGVVYVDKDSSLPLVTSPKTTMRVQGWKEENTTGKVAFTKTAGGAAITADANGYNVDTAARNNITATPSGDVEVKVYWERDAFTGTINLVRADGTTGYTEDKTKVYIELKDAATSGADATEHKNWVTSGANVIQTVTGGTATNAWTDTMLLNGHTYQVWVNGYNTGKTLTNTSATTTVKMFELTLDVKIDGQTDTVGDGSGTDYAPTDTKTQSTFKAGYAPNNTAGTGAFFVPEASGDVVITLAAQAAGTGLRYSKTADGTTFWTAGKGTLAGADNANTTLTLDTDATGMTDVTIYANYISVLTLTARAKTALTGVTGAVTGGSVSITAGGDANGTKNPISIDKDKVATVVATPSTTTGMNAYAFAAWSDVTPNGGAWKADAAGTAIGTGTPGATAYFAPSKDATLEASFKNLKASGTTVAGDTTTYPTANYAWSDTTGLTMTVKAGYTAGLSAPVDLSNLATDSTAGLSASIVAKTPGTGQTDGSSKISAGTIVATNLNANGGLDAGNATTVPVSFGTGLAIGTYVANLQVTDGAGLTVTVPITVKVEAPEEFDVSIKTFPDGATNPSGANIQSVVLVPTAGVTGNITLAETGAGSGVWTGKAKWAGTYTVYVDGYATSTTGVNNTPVANGTASVVEKEVRDLYTVSFAKDEYKDGSNLMGTPKFVTRAESGLTAYTVVPDKDTTAGALHAIVIPAGKQVTVTDGANPNTSGTYHYRAGGWNHYKVNTTTTATSAGVSGSNLYTVDATKPSTTSNAPIFLDPQYVQQFKLTLGTPKDAAATPAYLGNSTYVTAKFGGSNTLNSSQTANNSVMVDANQTVAITELVLAPSTQSGKYIFRQWDQDLSGATAGTFGTDASGNVTFVAKADTVLSPTYWEKPTLSEKDSYHLNFDKAATIADLTKWGSATPAKGSNTEPYYDWTQKDADLDGTDEFQISFNNGTNWTTLTLGTEVVKTTPSAGVVRYTIQDSYLKTLSLPDGQKNATYKVQVKSTINTSNDTTLKADLNLAVNPEKLEEVIIRVEQNKGATASVDDLNRDQVEYLSHKSTGIVKDNMLTYTWYYGDTAPTNRGPWADNDKFTKTDRDAYLASANAAAVAAGGTKLSTLDATVKDNTDSPLGELAPVTKAALKGKYIYAVVNASNTGYGAVITNAIAVDYDATVTVQKDGSSVSAATGYTVYLLEQNASNVAGYATMPAAAKTTTWNATNKNFETTNSALTGGVTYDVYVNKVEGNTSYYVKTGETVKPTSQSATVNFYSVNAVPTTVKSAQDSNNKPVGETFQDSDKPTTVFSTSGDGANVIPVTSGNGVFKGSAVTAKTSQGTFDQDYHVDWGVTTTEPTGGLSYNPETSKQDKATAAGTGITVTSSITAKTWAGVQLDQNLYTVTGNIWANDNTAGIVNTSAKLISGEYEFVGTTPNGTKGQNVTFSAMVPRSGAATGVITDKYSITADPKTTPLSTILGYVEWQNNVASVTETAINNALTNNRLDGTNQNILKAHITADNTQAFTIVVAASTYILTIPEVTGTHAKATQNWSTQGTNPGVATSGSNFTTAAWTEDYAYASGKTYTFKLVNEGNTYLDVALNVKRSNSADDGYVYGDKTSGTSGVAGSVLTASGSDMKDSVGVIFTGLATSFASLAPGAEKTFTVTIPSGVAVNDTADYAFEFTSTEASKPTVYGPSVTYKLTQTINPLKITDISSTAVSGGYNATGLVIKDSASSAVTLTTTQQAAEVEYKWYVTDIGVTPTLTKTGIGSLSTNASLAAGNQADGTYKTATGDQGKSLWVVAHNKATGNVIQAAMKKVTDLPYDLDIIVKENTTDVATANKGNYKVYLVPNTVTTPDFTPANLTAQGIVEATNTKTTVDGAYTAVGLDSNTTYKIYTNAVGGTTNANWQDSGATAALTNFTGNNPPVVTYRNVILSNTTVNNQQYSAAITTNDDPFYKTVDGTTVTSIGITALDAPTAKVGSTDVATDDVDKWVQSGTTVTMTYPAWTKDYALTWVGATSTGTNTPAAGDTATKQVTEKDTTIKTELKLNLYDFEVFVMGKGSVSQITLSGGTSGKYTSATAGSGFETGTVNTTSGAVSAFSSVGAGSSVTFRVPGGNYEVEATTASGTDLVGYREPHDATNAAATNIALLTLGVPTKKNMDVVVNTSGRAMSVADNADTQVTGATKASNTASYKSDTDKTSPTINQTITLPYGYDAVDLTLTVTNVGASETDTLFDVTMDKDDVDKDSTGKLSVTDPASASLIALDGSANLMMPASGTGDSTAVTLSIDDGLVRGSYHSTLVFTFSAEDGTTNDDKKASVTYNLTINVEPTKFTAVTVSGQDASGNVALGTDLSFDTYTTADINDWTQTPKTLTAGTDYTYQWYRGTAASASVSWSAGTATVTGATAIDSATYPDAATATLSGTTIANFPGEKIYLVISAVNNKNVIEAAISDPVTTGFQPVVKVSVDGTDQSTVSGFDGTGYTATITDGTTTWNTKWNATKGGFVPVDTTDNTTEVSLDATKTYTASVGRAKGDTTLVPLPNTDTMTLASPAITAKYFTVNAVATKDFEAIAGLGETFTSMPEVEFALGGNAIADATPVLSGQNVTAKIKAAWGEDYKLTWHTATTTTAPDPDDNAYENTAATGNNKTMTAQGTKQTAAEATAANASGNVAVTGKTYIGGRLDQNTYTITGKVVGTNNNASIIGVTVEKTDDPTKTYTWNKGDGKTDVIDPKDGNSNGSLNPNETIDFTVVKGTYTITSTADSSNTVISKAVWEPGQAAEETVTGPSGVLADEGVTASETKLTYNFEVHVDASELSLSVTDKTTADGDNANDITVTGALNNPGTGTKAVEHYFSYIDKKLADAAANDVITFPLKLENGGNVDMKVGLEVFHFASTSAVPAYTDQTKWDAGASRVKAPEFTAAASTTASVDVPMASASSKTVMTLSGVMAADTVVPAKASVGGTPDAVDALTITLGKDAWSKDSGVFVFRFTGESDAGKVHMFYVLNLTIDQLPIKAVTTQVNGAAATGMVGVGDKLQVEGYVDGSTAGEGLDHVTVNTSNKPDTAMAADAKLTDDDVHFAWVSVPKTETASAADILSRFTVNTTTGVLGPGTTGYQVKALDKEYTLVAADMDRDFYLIAYAPNTTATKTNATDKAISAVVKAKRTVGVQIGLNGAAESNIQPGVGLNDPQYTVYLQEAGQPLFEADGTTLAAGVLTTTWSNNSDKKYTAPIDLDKTYHVWAANYKGGADFVDTGLVLGKDGTNTIENQIVVYYNVEHTPNVAVDNGTKDGFASYLPGSIGTGKEANALQSALKVEVSDSATLSASTNWATLPAPTGTATSATVPVLSGMHLKVTVDATAASGNTTAANKTWGDAEPYHTMATTGWAKDTAATSQSGITYPAADGAGNRLVQSGDIVVNASKTFSAKLNQVLFTVNFVVQDNSSPWEGSYIQTPTTLTPDTAGGETGTGSITGAIGNGTGLASGVNGGNGAVVTFTNVPAGNYIIRATQGTQTKIDGYTWEDASALSIAGNIVAVTNTSDNANANGGNTIQIQHSTYSVKWMDNFVRTGTDAGTALEDGAGNPDPQDITDTGFQKVDTVGTGPFLGLTEGYSDTSDTLTYTVRLFNDGVMSLNNVYIEQTAGTSNMTVDWDNVRYKDADGTITTLTVDEDHPIDTLGVEEYLEFDVTIPTGKDASPNNYAAGFTLVFYKTGDATNFNPAAYEPAYQVKPEVKFNEGNALVYYGGNDFEAGRVHISKGWDTFAYNPTIVYTAATAEEVEQYLADNPTVTLPGNFYTSDGADVGSDATGTLPAWVSVAAGTGVVSFDASEGKRATEVNVQVDTATSFDNYTPNEVDNEIVFYIKAVNQNDTKVYFIPYTINVEPGQLSLPDNTYWWDQYHDTELDERSGEPVSFRHFTYTYVANQIGEHVVKPTDIAGDDANAVPNNTGLGNTDSKNKTVNANDVNTGALVHTGTWRVDKATYMLGDDVDYTFTIDYKPQDSKEKWNYKPGVAVVKITAVEPDRSLKFADVIGDAGDVVGEGASYHAPADDVTMVGKDDLVPQQLPLNSETYRQNEQITYLDTTPYYDVTLEKIGGVYGITLDVEKKTGVKIYSVSVDDDGNETETEITDLEAYSAFTEDTDPKNVNFRLKVSDLGGNLWAGTHEFKVTAKGYGSPELAEAGGEPDVVATYELKLIVRKKLIPEAHVSELTEPEKYQPQDKTVTVTIPDSLKDLLDEDGKDKYGNTPIDDVTVTYGPNHDPFQPGTTYTTTVTLTANDNYTFEDDKAPDETNYTAGNTPGADETYPDDNYTVTLTEDDRTKPEAGKNTKVEFTKTTPTAAATPEMKFADVIANADAVRPGEEYSKVEAPEDYDATTATAVPEKMAYTDKTFRKGEAITYLDTQPKYTVTLKNTNTEGDAVYKVHFDVVASDGLTVPTLADMAKFEANATKDFDIKIVAMDGDKLWVGKRSVTITATGYSTQALANAGGEPDVTATYELTFEITPKVITEGHVTMDPTDPTNPDKAKVEGKLEGDEPDDPDRDLTGDKPADNMEIPVKDVVITPDPEDPEKIKVTLVPDPNYVFDPVDETPDPEKPDYTINGDPKDKTENGPTIEKVGENVEMTTYIIFIGAHLEKKGESGGYAKTNGVTKGDQIANYVPFSDDQTKYPDNALATDTMTKYGLGKDWWWSVSTEMDKAIDLTAETAPTFEEGKTYVVTVKVYPDYDKYPFPTFADMQATFDEKAVEKKTNTTALYGVNAGFTQIDEIDGDYYIRYYYTIPKASTPSGGGGPAPCPNQVSFLLGLYGTTNDPVMEMVADRGKVKVVPGVTAVDGYKFLGWSQSAPTGDLEKDAKRELVKPEDVVIESDVTFYAVYEPDYRLGRPYHEHYVIGYPNGNFGPADNINRASVATIIARAVLPNFVEGADYGNPGGYSDVSGHWAASAIAYCSKYGVFQGYDDGTFRPDQFITRQELALVMARLSGIQTAQEMPFIDLDEAGDWAVDGIYTAYANGWVNGYVDGTFKPLANIRRDETVKIFNAYLYRGVNEEGLGKLVEYVHSGVASNVTENGTTEYMTWPDVTKDQWAYYEIIEAANDHEYVQDTSLKKGYTVPETWDKCWIDEKWRYHDDLSDGGPTMGLLSAGFRVWTR